MNKRKLNWRNLTAVCAVLTITLVQSVKMSRATTSPSALNTTATDVKLDSELRTLDSFFDDWLKVSQQHRVLSKRAQVTSVEFNAFKSSSEGIKNRCSQFEGAVRDIIRKLKAADRWDGLDDEVLGKTNDERLKSDLRESGGLKRLLEGAASSYCSQAESEITGPVETLRTKVAALGQPRDFGQPAQDYRMVQASYEPAAPVFTHTLRCLGATIRVAAHLVGSTIAHGNLGQTPSGASSNRQCFSF